MISTLLSSLAAQYPVGHIRRRFGRGLASSFSTARPKITPARACWQRSPALLPHGVDVGDWRDVPRDPRRSRRRAQRRQESKTDGPELFLFIHDLPRFRDLRRREDDFSFSKRDEDASPADHLDAILREGPLLGIHVIVWCDTVNNLNRCFHPSDSPRVRDAGAIPDEPDRLGPPARLAPAQASWASIAHSSSAKSKTGSRSSARTEFRATSGFLNGCTPAREPRQGASSELFIVESLMTRATRIPLSARGSRSERLSHRARQRHRTARRDGDTPGHKPCPPTFRR